MSNPSAPGLKINIDVIIDVVCPWCYIGKKTLDLAIAERAELIGAVAYHPFQLSPDAPEKGVSRNSYYSKKFGDSLEFKASREHLITRGKSMGLHFEYNKDGLIANTMDAHRLIRWARSINLEAQAKIVDRLMYLYFSEAQFIGDHTLLVEVARDCGMDGDIVADLLATDQDKDAITHSVYQAHRMGVQGVPCFIFNQQHAVSGAEEKQALLDVIDRLTRR